MLNWSNKKRWNKKQISVFPVTQQKPLLTPFMFAVLLQNRIYLCWMLKWPSKKRWNTKRVFVFPATQQDPLLTPFMFAVLLQNRIYLCWMLIWPNKERWNTEKDIRFPCNTRRTTAHTIHVCCIITKQNLSLLNVELAKQEKVKQETDIRFPCNTTKTTAHTIHVCCTITEQNLSLLNVELAKQEKVKQETDIRFPCNTTKTTAHTIHVCCTITEQNLSLLNVELAKQETDIRFPWYTTKTTAHAIHVCYYYRSEYISAEYWTGQTRKGETRNRYPFSLQHKKNHCSRHSCLLLLQIRIYLCWILNWPNKKRWNKKQISLFPATQEKPLLTPFMFATITDQNISLLNIELAKQEKVKQETDIPFPCNTRKNSADTKFAVLLQNRIDLCWMMNWQNKKRWKQETELKWSHLSYHSTLPAPHIFFPYTAHWKPSKLCRNSSFLHIICDKECKVQWNKDPPPPSPLPD